MATLVAQRHSRTIYEADGVTESWNFTFSGGYLDKSHVQASVTVGEVTTQLPVTPASFIGDYQLRITPAVANGAVLTIYRDTPKNLPLVDFTDGSGLTEISLDTNAKQAVFVSAEAVDSINSVVTADIKDAASSAVAAATSAAGSAASASASASSASSSAGIALAASARADEVANALAGNMPLIQTAATHAALAESKANAAISAAATASASALDATTKANRAALSEALVEIDRLAVSADTSYVASAVAAITAAQAEVNAILGLGIGSSSVAADGHLIMTYSGTVTDIAIDGSGRLTLTY